MSGGENLRPAQAANLMKYLGVECRLMVESAWIKRAMRLRFNFVRELFINCTPFKKLTVIILFILLKVVHSFIFIYQV